MDPEAAVIVGAVRNPARPGWTCCAPPPATGRGPTPSMLCRRHCCRRLARPR